MLRLLISLSMEKNQRLATQQEGKWREWGVGFLFYAQQGVKKDGKLSKNGLKQRLQEHGKEGTWSKKSKKNRFLSFPFLELPTFLFCLVA